MSASLVPDPSRLHLALLQSGDHCITMLVSTTASSPACACCSVFSTQVHSHYDRTLADLPWNGIPVRLRLTVRRFRCRTDTCKRRLFTERLPGIVAPYARCTARCAEALALIGFIVGGEAGSRRLLRLGLRGS